MVACADRVLAEDVRAEVDVPGFARAAMDGYAVRGEDTFGATSYEPVTLALRGEALPGRPWEGVLEPGQALRVMTGAPLPKGADAVVMAEVCSESEGRVEVSEAVSPAKHVGDVGEDVRAGTVIIRSGRLLRAQEIGLAASVGRSGMTVRRRLRTAVLSTGDEVCDPGGEAPPGCIFDANRYTIMGLLEGLGCEVTDLGILPDTLDAIRDALAGAADAHDLIVTSGGMSRGEEDHVKEAVESLGTLHFWRLAIKPGRPIALGTVGETAFVGLPGNPVAVMVTFMRIARPVVLLLSGRSDIEPPRFRVRAGFDFKKKLGRREWLRARLVTDADGGVTAIKHPAAGAGILTSMVESDGLIELAEDQGALVEGTMVDFLPFAEVTR